MKQQKVAPVKLKIPIPVLIILVFSLLVGVGSSLYLYFTGRLIVKVPEVFVGDEYQCRFDTYDEWYDFREKRYMKTVTKDGKMWIWIKGPVTGNQWNTYK